MEIHVIVLCRGKIFSKLKSVTTCKASNSSNDKYDYICIIHTLINIITHYRKRETRKLVARVKVGGIEKVLKNDERP